jgi:undecaprenyl-diphosphatase
MKTFTVAVPSIDERLLRRLAARGPGDSIYQVMRILSRLGDGPIWYLTGTAAALLGGHPGRRFALLGIAAGGLNALIYCVCKRRFIRPRPFRTLPDLPILWAPPTDFSFPSGHTQLAFASATLLALHFPFLGPAAFILAFLIALSRIVLAVHYPSDVLAGAWIGVLVAIGLNAAF